MEFQRGDEVEIMSREQGLVGSYYAATVISQISKDEYIVQYRTLLMEDESRPLREIVVAGDVRPAPPPIPETCFRQRDSVDAFDKDGWWVGLITRRKGSKYYVFFEASGERIAYPLDRLRGHLDWLNGKWVSPNKKEK